MKIHFFHHSLATSINELNFTPNDGLDHWITTTFLKLKNNFENLTIGPEIPLDGVIVFHKRYFPVKIKPSKNQFFLCLQVDSGRHYYAQWHLVHNPYQDNFFYFPKLIIDFLFGFSKTKFICPWPQHKMIVREISRKETFKNISFHGNISNIPKELISEDFKLFLKENNLELKVKSNHNVWNDFSDSDLSVCFRSFDDKKYFFKPYLKIMNSLLAGVPVVSGYDSSSMFFRKNYVNIPLVKNISELQELILKVVDKHYNSMEQISEFEKYKSNFLQDEIQKSWILVFKQIEYDYNKWMRLSDFNRGLFFKVREFNIIMTYFFKLYFSFFSKIKNMIKSLLKKIFFKCV